MFSFVFYDDGFKTSILKWRRPSIVMEHSHTYTHTNTIFFNNDPFVQSVSGREWSPTNTHTNEIEWRKRKFVTLEKKKKKRQHEIVGLSTNESRSVLKLLRVCVLLDEERGNKTGGTLVAQTETAVCVLVAPPLPPRWRLSPSGGVPNGDFQKRFFFLLLLFSFVGRAWPLIRIASSLPFYSFYFIFFLWPFCKSNPRIVVHTFFS